MPTWTKSPPPNPSGYGLPLVRTPATRSIRGIITSTNLIGTDTHFWGGHTVPCERPECPACFATVPYRWHGYVAAYNDQTQLHFIFEMTAQAAVPFQEYFKENETLRCGQFEAYRWQKRRNGRVIVRVTPSAMRSHAIPHEPDLPKMMAVIWRLAAKSVKVEGIERGSPAVQASSDGNGQSTDPRSYSLPFNPADPARS